MGRAKNHVFPEAGTSKGGYHWEDLCNTFAKLCSTKYFEVCTVDILFLGLLTEFVAELKLIRDELGFRILKYYDMSSHNSVHFRLHSQEQHISMLSLTQERSFSIELKRIFLCSLEGLYTFLYFKYSFTRSAMNRLVGCIGS